MAKTLVVCSDGTWNDPDQKVNGVYTPTNVVKMAQAVAPTTGNGEAQIIFYDPGVGTGGWADRLLGGAFGKGLSKNVKDAYVFLIQNFHPGDRVFCFGFSRGAYTVRSLCGLVGSVGLLKKSEWARYHEAYDLYRLSANDPTRPAAIQQFSAFTQACAITFLGVWDTVGSLGIPVGRLKGYFLRKYKFHDVKLGAHIGSAFQALAIDEQRKNFTPAIWEAGNIRAGQQVQQAWFPGAHSDVGGGYLQSGASDCAFEWMADRAESCGLELNRGFIRANIACSVTNALHDEMEKLGWRIQGRHVRTIASGQGANECIHASTLQRQQAGSYTPANLAKATSRGAVQCSP